MHFRSIRGAALSIGAVCAALASGGVRSQSRADAPAAAAQLAAPQAAPKIEASAMAILKRVETRMIGLKTYQAECWTTLKFAPGPDGASRPNSYEMAILTAVKPNLMRYDSWTMKVDANGAWSKEKDTPVYTFACNGKANWKQFGAHYRPDKRMAPRDMGTILEPWTGFYAASASPFEEAKVFGGVLLEAHDAGADVVDGTPVEKVFLHIKSEFGESSQEYRTTYYVASDGLVRRKVSSILFDGKGGYTSDATLRAIKMNEPVAVNSNLFTYKPPSGVTLEDPKPRKQLPLLANGVAAPDFTAVDKDGKSLTLASLKGKVVVIDFWASWCPPCKASMPHNQEVAKKLQAEGVPVVLLAVDNGEDHDAFAAWVRAHSELESLQFAYVDPKALDLSGKTYQVTGIPTQYVIDANGIIRASLVGFGGPTDDLENAVRAALKDR